MKRAQPFTQRELDAINEALHLRLAGEVSPPDEGVQERPIYESALRKIQQRQKD